MITPNPNLKTYTERLSLFLWGKGYETVINGPEVSFFEGAINPYTGELFEVVNTVQTFEEAFAILEKSH